MRSCSQSGQVFTHLCDGPVRVVSYDVIVDLPVDGSRSRSGGHVTTKTDISLTKLDVDGVADDVRTVYTVRQTRQWLLNVNT